MIGEPHRVTGTSPRRARTTGRISGSSGGKVHRIYARAVSLSLRGALSPGVAADVLADLAGRDEGVLVQARDRCDAELREHPDLHLVRSARLLLARAIRRCREPGTVTRVTSGPFCRRTC
ncbi:MAG TPA: hypothetical protein VIL48_18785 [Acidimicrobiales bacterium]